MAKKKIINVYVKSSANYDDLKSYEILPGGCLKIVEQNGDVRVFSPSTDWHVMERIER